MVAVAAAGVAIGVIRIDVTLPLAIVDLFNRVGIITIDVDITVLAAVIAMMFAVLIYLEISTLTVSVCIVPRPVTKSSVFCGSYER